MHGQPTLRSLTFQITDDVNNPVRLLVLQFVLLFLWFQEVPLAWSSVSCEGGRSKIYPCLQGVLVLTPNSPHSSFKQKPRTVLKQVLFPGFFFLNPSILAAFCVINSQDKKVIQLSARIQNVLFTWARVRDYPNDCHSTFISCQVPVLVLPQTTSHTVNPMNGQ